jgi:hypothetical protein
MIDDAKTNKKSKVCVGISNSRTKREVKKPLPYDNSEYVLEDAEIDQNVKGEPGDVTTQNRSNRNRASAPNLSNGSKLTPA